MMQEGTADKQAKSRQDQILLLAAEGLTDKEIAARLSLSPETVGTYWRRILSKYSAASRTEVVAKVVRLQAEASMSEVSEVNECLREVADHLLLVLSGRNVEELARLGFQAQILAVLPDIIVTIDGEGFVTYVNHSPEASQIDSGQPFEWSVAEQDREALRDAIALALDGQPGGTLPLHLTGGGQTYQCQVLPAVLDELPSAVLVLREA